MDYTDKFKQRTPQETINIITKFFEDRGYTIKTTSVVSEANTYSNLLEVFYNGHMILHSNGKGITPEFSLASGLGELYERFSSGEIYYENKLLMDKLFKANLKEYGYRIDPNESDFTAEEVLQIPTFYDEFVNIECNGNYEHAKELIETYPKELKVGVPYVNAVSNEVKNLPEGMIRAMYTSTGLATGNSFYEAFNQGFSELCERSGWYELFTHLERDHYFINPDKVQNPRLKQVIADILKTDKKLYIMDLGYTTGLPVVGVIVVDLKTHRTFLDFGSFPVFDIALERCLTEVYQMLPYLQEYKPQYSQVPSKNENIVVRLSQKFLSYGNDFFCIPHQFIDNAIMVDSEDKSIYISNNTNENIYEYYKGIIAKKDWEVYVRDTSLIKDMSSVSIFIANKNTLCSDVYHFEDPTSYSKFITQGESEWRGVIDMLKLFNKIMELFESEEYNPLEILKIYYSNELFKMKNELLNCHIDRPYCNGGPNKLFDYPGMSHIDMEFYDAVARGNAVYLPNSPTIFNMSIRKYIVLHRYMVRNNYTRDELNKIFDILGIDCTEEDYKNWNNKSYIIEQSLIKPLYKFYNSEDMNNIVKSFKKED